MTNPVGSNVLTADLDPKFLAFLNTSKLYIVREWKPSSSSISQNAEVSEANMLSADVVSSEVRDTLYGKLHRPVIDIDIPAYLIPSSTPGHSHLYIDKMLSWSDYSDLLSVMADVGIVQRGFYNIAQQRKATMVRLPWIRK